MHDLQKRVEHRRPGTAAVSVLRVALDEVR